MFFATACRVCLNVEKIAANGKAVERGETNSVRAEEDQDVKRWFVVAIVVFALPAAAIGGDAAPPAETAAHQIIVTGVDGAVHRGDPSPTSDGRALRFSRGRPGMTITRAIAWDRIAQVEVAGQVLSADEARSIILRAVSELPPQRRRPGPVIASDESPDNFASRRPSRAGEGSRDDLREEPIAWIAVEAAAAQWDSDVEFDGIRLSITAYDRAGRARPVDGTLQAELWGEDAGTPHRAERIARIGSWQQRIRANDFRPEAAVVRIPFQAVHPEFERSLRPYGTLHVRLSVPGQGTFESSVEMIRLRPYSAARDRLQMATGRRFFEGETTADGRR